MGFLSLHHSLSLSFHFFYTCKRSGSVQPECRWSEVKARYLFFTSSLSRSRLSAEPWVKDANQSAHSLRLRHLCSGPDIQDSASLKVSLSCTPTDLMELAVRKWLTTHGPEEETLQGQYVLRVSHCLEFLHGDHPLSQYKVSVSAWSSSKSPG